MDLGSHRRTLRPRCQDSMARTRCERLASRKKIHALMKKSQEVFTEEDRLLLKKNENLVKILMKNREKKALQRDRLREFEDPKVEVERKCQELARALKESRHAVVYTGAGISTSANIPDYRGSHGVWTFLKDGKDMPVTPSLTTSKPTLSHMCLQKLYCQGTVKHVVSQNCDGLHLRSGIPSSGLSEIHGNMYAEVCKKCECMIVVNGISQWQTYYRIFDVTTKTSLRRHKTDRECPVCGEKLEDTIVHFGERSNLKWPHNWEGAIKNARECDLILCLGTSLKVLRSYKHLWMMDRPASKRPALYIVNLQWTPKDSQAKLKIHARVDDVLSSVMQMLGLDIPTYSHENDALISLATPCDYQGEIISIPEAVSKKFCVQTKNESTPISSESDKFLKSDSKFAPSWFGKGIRVKQRKRKKNNISKSVV